MGNLFTYEKKSSVLSKTYENWGHYAVNGANLSQIEETLISNNINYYKYHTMEFGSQHDELHHYVAFPPTDKIKKLPNCWMPTAAPFHWFLEKGYVYTDMNI